MKDDEKSKLLSQIISKPVIDMAELADWSEIDALQGDLLQMMINEYNGSTDDSVKEHMCMCIKSLLGILPGQVTLAPHLS